MPDFFDGFGYRLFDARGRFAAHRYPIKLFRVTTFQFRLLFEACEVDLGYHVLPIPLIINTIALLFVSWPKKGPLAVQSIPEATSVDSRIGWKDRWTNLLVAHANKAVAHSFGASRVRIGNEKR